MKYSIQDYELELIDEPLQGHVVAWEKASRSLKSEDAKPLLNALQTTFSQVDVSNLNLQNMLNTFVEAATLLARAIKILEDNETLTSTANHGVMFKAALQAGWVISCTKAGQPILKTTAEVDAFKPWFVTWAANHIARLYLEATDIPKN